MKSAIYSETLLIVHSFQMAGKLGWQKDTFYGYLRKPVYTLANRTGLNVSEEAQKTNLFIEMHFQVYLNQKRSA